ncbi:MAG: hypothetical protein ACI94L_001450, partial [Flavobacteriaceae bacterium]
MFNSRFNFLFVTSLLLVLSSYSFSADINMPFGQKAFEIYKTSVEMRTAEGQHQVPTLARYLASE